MSAEQSTNSQRHKVDILVIGGGIIGVAAAYYLARAGRSVTLIEREHIGAGSSPGNAGLIANGFVLPLAAPGAIAKGLKWMLRRSSPFSIRPRLDMDLIAWLWKFAAASNEVQMRKSIPALLLLGQSSLDLFENLHRRENVHFGYERKGRLVLFKSEAALQKWEADIRLMREFGVELTLHDAGGLRHFEPNLSPQVQYGLYCPAYAHLDPARFVQEMARLSSENGAIQTTGVCVKRLERIGNHISAVHTTAEVFAPDQVVLAAGAWSPELAREVDVRLPIQPAKGYSLTFEMPSNGPHFPLQLAEQIVAVTPIGGLLRMTGVLDLAGFDPSLDHHRLEAIRRAAEGYFPDTDKWGPGTPWYGYRPMTPDDLPVIGRSAKIRNLVFATGHGTLGVTHALATGKLVSQIVADQPPLMDLSPFQPDRF